MFMSVGLIDTKQKASEITRLSGPDACSHDGKWNFTGLMTAFYLYAISRFHMRALISVCLGTNPSEGCQATAILSAWSEIQTAIVFDYIRE